MGFAHLPQWERHQIERGICMRCQKKLGYEGTVCDKGEPGTDQYMILLGDFAHAKDCTA